MKTATRPDELERLGNRLQEGLQSKLPESIPVQVRCQLKDEILAIWVQHPEDAIPEQQQVFDFIEQNIHLHNPPASKKIQLYLKKVGQKQPYAFHSFPVEPVEADATPIEPLPETPFKESEPSPAKATNKGQDAVDAPSPPPSQDSGTADTSPHPWDQPIPNPEVDESSEKTPPSVKTRLKASWLPLIAAGTGLSLVVFLGTLYLLTRPCVIGECRAIPEAEQLSQKSAKTLQNPESGKAVLEAQAQLQEAIELVEAIPPWSSHHNQARELSEAYQGQAETVADMVEALKTAARAGYQSQNPPHAESKWIEIQNLWREAIAKLEQLPTDSNLQPLAKQKIKAYKTNLEEINQRLLKERQAQGHLQAAKEAARMAQARQGVAQTLADWQLVYATWQTIMKRLKQIPQGTTAYKEAQELSALYLPDMTSARDRKTQEQIAANAYNQGVRLAQLATDSQNDSQWSVALIHWRNALTYVNQVPRDTYYYGKARILVEPYKGALKQAQGQLQLAVKLQQARSDLNQTCSGSPQVCSYTLDKKAIKVRLTPAYVEMVRQRELSARAKGDSNSHSSIVNHILTLGEALEAISDNAEIPLEVYSPDGTLIESHNPSS
ncbi:MULTISPECIES: hypothetical protein [unclassified Coleofasciculus]|uniref:hypothetical protein n=1 Tax=unclassified Coleofasciculus TaxID=2692782 RepID=UPI0018802C25|nr:MULTISPECIES: hypothetical protein [unclassified Coleofasciculus]MBE9128835.1 hypothetical protein [Coleofasciculus sp. LEGE 07081]MBE9148481.1 hypothetical protein [Coleofasciculus sp. LEGE 07092]